jgi:L-ectoine synthase
MKVIDVYGLKETERDVRFPTGMISLRALLAKDGMGFSMHKTIIPRGVIHHWHYKNHLEACYCICGSGILTNLRTHQRHMIREDMVYVLDEHDDHTFETVEDTVLISVFNPPVTGAEVHDADGSYAPAEAAHA